MLKGNRISSLVVFDGALKTQGFSINLRVQDENENVKYVIVFGRIVERTGLAYLTKVHYRESSFGEKVTKFHLKNIKAYVTEKEYAKEAEDLKIMIGEDTNIKCKDVFCCWE